MVAKLSELGLHPIAETVLRYLTLGEGASPAQRDLPRLEAETERALLALPPAAAVSAGNDLLKVARVIRNQGRALEAETIAELVSRSMQRSAARSGRTAVLSEPTEQVGRGFAALTGKHQPAPLPMPPPTPARARQPGPVEQYQDQLDDERLERIARAAALATRPRSGA